MKKIILFLSALSFIFACHTPTEENSSVQPKPKVLVAYFSHSGENYGVGEIKEGNTQKVAQEIARQTGGTLFRIQPVKKYPAEYDACKETAKNEKDTNARPELKAHVENMDEYDVIYLGYPIWWGDMPMPLFTFIEHYNLEDKTIYPFATHEGSGMGGSETSLKQALPKSTVAPGLAIKGHVAQKEHSAVYTAVTNWLKHH